MLVEPLPGGEAVCGPVCAIVSRCRLEDQRQPAQRVTIARCTAPGPSRPEAERRGPIAVDESGMPFQRRYYREVYEQVARVAGVPKEVWNMRAAMAA